MELDYSTPGWSVTDSGATHLGKGEIAICWRESEEYTIIGSLDTDTNVEILLWIEADSSVTSLRVITLGESFDIETPTNYQLRRFRVKKEFASSITIHGFCTEGSGRISISLPALSVAGMPDARMSVLAASTDSRIVAVSLNDSSGNRYLSNGEEDITFMFGDVIGGELIQTRRLQGVYNVKNGTFESKVPPDFGYVTQSHDSYVKVTATLWPDDELIGGLEHSLTMYLKRVDHVIAELPLVVIAASQMTTVIRIPIRTIVSHFVGGRYRTVPIGIGFWSDYDLECDVVITTPFGCTRVYIEPTPKNNWYSIQVMSSSEVSKALLLSESALSEQVEIAIQNSKKDHVFREVEVARASNVSPLLSFAAIEFNGTVVANLKCASEDGQIKDPAFVVGKVSFELECADGSKHVVHSFRNPRSINFTAEIPKELKDKLVSSRLIFGGVTCSNTQLVEPIHAAGVAVTHNIQNAKRTMYITLAVAVAVGVIVSVICAVMAG